MGDGDVNFAAFQPQHDSNENIAIIDKGHTAQRFARI